MDPATRAALEALLANEDAPSGAAEGGASGPQPDADGNYPVRLVLAVEGHETSDRRLIAPGALSTRAFPQSIAAQTQPGHGGEPGPSIICGRLDSAERVPGPEVRSRETGQPFPEGTFVWRGTGVLFGEKGKPAEHGSPLDLVLKGGLTGNSVDLNSVEVELTFDAEPEGDAGPFGAPDSLPGDENPDGTRTLRPPRPPLQTFTKAMLGMTTLVPVPAFAEAYVEVGTGDGWEVITPAAELAEVEGSPFITADLPADEEQGAVVASGAEGADPVPPAWWFDQPTDRTAGLGRAVPLQVDDPDPSVGGLRRVWGYVAGWDSCHTGFTDRCVPPPRSPSGYAAYHVGTTVATDGQGALVSIATGPLTVGGGHASKSLRRVAAIAHYDDVCTCAGRLRCGEDAFGIWAAGYLWPEASDADVRIIRASPPSGDWRAEHRQPQDMIGVHAVNTPGYRSAPVTAYRLDEHGATQALVAAGALDPEPPTPSGAVILDYDVLAERIAERMRAGAIPVHAVRPDYAEGDEGGSTPQCSQAGCGNDATKLILTKGDGSPQKACDQHAEGIKAKAGPGATVKSLSDGCLTCQQPATHTVRPAAAEAWTRLACGTHLGAISSAAGTGAHVVALADLADDDGDELGLRQRRALALGGVTASPHPVALGSDAEGHKPPQGVVSNAKRALELIADGKAGAGFSSVGRARARQLASGSSVSMATVRAMNAYFARHGASSQQEDHGGTSPAAVAWLAWGGDAGKRWASGIVRQADAQAVGAGLDVFAPPQVESSVWHPAHDGQQCSRWASQHDGGKRPAAVACRESGGSHLGACAPHKREMTRGQSMGHDGAGNFDHSDGDAVLAFGLATLAWRDDLAGLDVAAELDEDDAFAIIMLDADEASALLGDDAPEPEALAGKKKRGNWVTQVGGLPKLIKRVAKHLQEKGMEESHAIATAVNVVKKYCRNRDLNFPGKQNIKAETIAKGCSAVAEWEAKKARARADNG